MVKPPLHFTIHEKISDDLRNLKEKDLQLLALKKIKLIKSGHLQGRPLGDHRTTGDLRDCFKVLFDTRTDLPPRFRIVYRQQNQDLEILFIEVLSIGERYQLEAYISAAERLGRLPVEGEY
jgi:hypothetical protein